MTDINRLIASLKRRSSHVKDFGDDITFVKLEDLDALVEELELKVEQRANWFQMAQKLGENLDAAEKRIADLESARDEIPFGIDTNSELELAAFKMALAAMDSEPVDSNYRKLFTCTGCGAEGLDEPLETNCHCCVDGAHWVDSRLYLHAQPAPVTAKPVGFINDAREPVLYGEHIGIAIGAQLYAVPQPAPVVPEEMPSNLRGLIEAHTDRLFDDDDAQEIWSACRAAMLAAAPQEVKSES